jgi:hypothetical protein
MLIGGCKSIGFFQRIPLGAMNIDRNPAHNPIMNVGPVKHSEDIEKHETL